MTISVSANNARVRYTATSSQTAFAIPFEFTDNDEITVFVATTALVAAAERGQGTGSTEYGISGGGGATGAIAFVTGITQGHIVTIVRDIPIERTTDFTAGTTINRAALNTQLDNITAMIGDLKDKSDRAIRLQPYDSEITLFLPTIGSRAGKIFGFDTNGNLTADTSANFDITLDDVVTNTITMGGNVNSKFDIIAVSDSRLTTNGAVLDIKSTKNGNTADIKLDGSATYGIDLNAGNKAIRLQDATLFSSTVEVSGVSTLASVTTAAINSLSGGDISLKALGNQVNILGIGGQNRITFHNPSAPSMEFFGDSSIIGSGSFLLDIVDGIILDSAAGEILLKDAGVLRMTIGFNGSAQTITSAGDLTIASSASGISIKPASSSTDFLATNGTQTIGIISSVVTPHLKWYQNSNTTLLKVVDPSATRTLLLPNESGTIHSSGGATTHANITVSTDGKVQFRDSAIYIQSGADGHLDLVADTEIQIAATTVNVDGLMDISGNLSVGGNLDVTGTIDFSDSNITNVGSITLDRIANDGAGGITLDSSSAIILDAGSGSILLKDDSTTRLTIAINNSANQTITSLAILSLTSGGDINLRPNGGQLYVLNNSGGDNFQFNTSATPTLGIHQNSNVTNLGLVNPTGTRNILFPDASDTLVGKATTDTLTNKTLTAPTLTGTTVVASLDISGDIDVFGTTNLDVVDIDGAVNMATTALVTGILTTTAATVFNGGFASNDDSTVDGTLGVTGLVSPAAGITVVGSTTVDDILLTAVALPGTGNPSIALRNSDNIVYHQSGSANQIAFLDSGQNSMALFHDDAISFNIDNSAALSIDGDRDVIVGTGGQLRVAGGAASAPSYSFTGDPDTGISRPTTNAVNIVTAGTERIRITSAGKVGIGIAAPAQNLAVKVGSDIIVGVWGDNSAGYGAIQSANVANNAYKQLRFDASSYHFAQGGVGIGIAAPAAGLHLKAADGSTSGTIMLTATGVASAGMACNASGLNFGADTGGFVFKTGATASDPTDTGATKVLIASNGQSEFTVSATNAVATGTGALNVIAATARTSGNGPFIGFRVPNSTGGVTHEDMGVIGFVSPDATDGNRLADFIITTRSASGSSEKFRIAANGTITATDTSIGSNSDSRLKKDIVDYAYDWDTFKTYNVKKFNWKQPQFHMGKTNQIGFIAQDLQSVDSQWVGATPLQPTDGDGNAHVEAQYLDADLVSLTSKLGEKDAMYVSIIQQLIAKVETLEAKVTALEG